MRPELSREWLASATSAVAAGAERELDALVAVSSPSGDRGAAEEICAVVTALLPPGAEVERPPCSSPEHAPDLLATLTGSGSARVLLLGHLDTVVPDRDHHPLEAVGGRLVGSGAIDMKGGVVLALGVLRALAELPACFAELSLLAVNDEEWRTGGFEHGPRFAGYDACLCFEAGELGPGAEEGVIGRRKAAATMRVTARGLAAHSGSAPEQGRNALLALAEAARRVAELNDPAGPERLTAVPTVIRAGEAFNVVPPAGELVSDLRADRLEAFEPLLDTIPAVLDEVELEESWFAAGPGWTPGARSKSGCWRRRGAARPTAGRDRARWRQRREPPGRARAAHRRRARPARRPRPQPGGVRASRLAAFASRGRAGDRGGGAQPRPMKCRNLRKC